MTKSQHTPTPWKHRYTCLNGKNSNYYVSGEKIEDLICNVLGGSQDEKAANAALIVKAVNEREGLITFVGQVILAHEQGECSVPADILKQAYALLAKAEAE